MNTYSIKSLTLLTISGVLIFGVLEMGFIYFFFPEHYTQYMWGIPAYFLLFAIILSIVLIQTFRKEASTGKAISKLMLLNVAQLLISIALLFLYTYIINVKHIAFLLAFGAFYLFFLVIRSFSILYANQKHETLEKMKGGAE